MVGLKNLNLLFLEDNLEFAKNTIEALNLHFKEIYHYDNIQDALSAFLVQKIDVVISDIVLKDGNGLDFIVEIREFNKTIPIIVLSAYKDEEFLFKAIPLNILSYEVKPLSYNSLNSVLKKISKEFNQESEVQITNDLKYSFYSKELYENSNSIKLTKKEIDFIELLLKHYNTVVQYHIIQRDIWEEKQMSDAALKNFVFRLRKKVKNSFISTVANVGYKLNISY